MYLASSKTKREKHVLLSLSRRPQSLLHVKLNSSAPFTYPSTRLAPQLRDNSWCKAHDPQNTKSFPTEQQRRYRLLTLYCAAATSSLQKALKTLCYWTAPYLLGVLPFCQELILTVVMSSNKLVVLPILVPSVHITHQLLPETLTSWIL